VKHQTKDTEMMPSVLIDQAAQSLWTENSLDDKRESQFIATIAALGGIRPKDELEGMMAAQLIAAHNATMECYRRAMLSFMAQFSV
jgi:hypothetical protein